MTARSRRLRKLAGYPLTLLAANLAWMVFSLPVVTWFAAGVALVHALDRRFEEDGRGVLSGFWEGWRRTWRRTLPLGLASTVAALILLLNAGFLLGQDSPAAFLLLAGTVPLALVWLFWHVSLIPVVALFPHLTTRQWLRDSFALSFQHPGAMLAVLAAAVLAAGAVLAVPALLPLCGASLPALLALKLCRHHLPRWSDV